MSAVGRRRGANAVVTLGDQVGANTAYRPWLRRASRRTSSGAAWALGRLPQLARLVACPQLPHLGQQQLQPAFHLHLPPPHLLARGTPRCQLPPSACALDILGLHRRRRSCSFAARSSRELLSRHTGHAARTSSSLLTGHVGWGQQNAVHQGSTEAASLRLQRTDDVA